MQGAASQAGAGMGLGLAASDSGAGSSLSAAAGVSSGGNSESGSAGIYYIQYFGNTIIHYK